MKFHLLVLPALCLSFGLQAQSTDQPNAVGPAIEKATSEAAPIPTKAIPLAASQEDVQRAKRTTAEQVEYERLLREEKKIIEEHRKKQTSREHD